MCREWAAVPGQPRGPGGSLNALSWAGWESRSSQPAERTWAPPWALGQQLWQTDARGRGPAPSVESAELFRTLLSGPVNRGGGASSQKMPQECQTRFACKALPKRLRAHAKAAPGLALLGAELGGGVMGEDRPRHAFTAPAARKGRNLRLNR